MIFVGDLGGTKTQMALYSDQGDACHPLVVNTYRSADFDSLESIIDTFLAATDTAIDYACIAVAGPVVDGRAKITNLPWVVDTDLLLRHLPVRRLRLINDLQAIAKAVPLLGRDDLCTLNAGHPKRRGTIAVIAPGTGLGEAFLIWNGVRYEAQPSEAGHADFAPTSSRQRHLLSYLAKSFKRVSCERVCSGNGIVHLYRFLRDNRRMHEPQWFAEQIAAVADPAPLIMENALEKNQKLPLCVETARLFASILGSEAGNMALRLMATGGVYLGGGIPPSILPLLQDSIFIESFTAKGRFSDLVSAVPVHVILNRQAALLGALQVSLEDK